MIPAPLVRTIRTVLFLVAPLVCLCLPGCGYIVGGPYRHDIQTVHVPIFTSTSLRRDVEFQLTEAVHREIQKQTDFRLARESEADTKLTGRITGIKKNGLGESAFDDVRELQFQLVVHVTWEDLRGRRTSLDKQIALSPADVIALTSTGDFGPELGPSMATARKRAIDNLARQVVQLMQTPW